MTYNSTMNTKQEHSNLKDERIYARVTGDHKCLFEQAASLRGLSLTDFVVLSAYEQAVKVIKDSDTVLHLNSHDSRHFVDSLLSPRSVKNIPRLARAFREYDHDSQ